MIAIVLDLQAECLKDDSKASSIIRKAFVIATKLGIADFADWANKELNGYIGTSDSVPSYREVAVDYRAHNPYRGWIPVMIPSASDFAVLLRRSIGESVEQLEALIASSDGTLTFRLDADIQQAMNANGPANFEINGFIGKVQFVGILKAVRNTVLEWTLKLEKAGIVGEGLSFTEAEVRTAASGIVNYGTIIMGNVEGSQVIGSGSGNTQEMVYTKEEVEGLKSLLTQIQSNSAAVGFSKEQKEEVDSKVVELQQLVGTEPLKKSKAKGLLTSLKTIFEGVIGNVVASGVICELSKYLPH